MKTVLGRVGQRLADAEVRPVRRPGPLGRVEDVVRSLRRRGLGICRTRVAAGAERRFFAYLLLIQALVISWLLLALASPATLDALTRDQRVRGILVEAPVDRATAWVLLAGSVLCLVVVVMTLRRAGRGAWFWIGYGLLLALGTLEESDWLRAITGRPPTVAGREVEGLHDLLQILHGPGFRARGGTVEYPLAPDLVLAALLVGIGALGLALRLVARTTRSLDAGMSVLIVLGAVLAGLGALVDANFLPVPVHFERKAPLEEPLEALGALCLAIVAAEAALRTVATRSGGDGQTTRP